MAAEAPLHFPSCLRPNPALHPAQQVESQGGSPLPPKLLTESDDRTHLSAMSPLGPRRPGFPPYARRAERKLLLSRKAIGSGCETRSRLPLQPLPASGGVSQAGPALQSLWWGKPARACKWRRLEVSKFSKPSWQFRGGGRGGGEEVCKIQI